MYHKNVVSQFRNTSLEDTEQFRAASSREMFFYCKLLTAYYWVWQLAEQDQHRFSQVFEPSSHPHLSRHQYVQIQPKAPWTDLADFSWYHHFLGLSIGRKLTPPALFITVLHLGTCPNASEWKRWPPHGWRQRPQMTAAVQRPAAIRWKMLRL